MSKQEKDFEQMYRGLKRILGYMSPEQIQRRGKQLYGCEANEVLEMAYENVIGEAKAAIKGVRLPKVKA